MLVRLLVHKFLLMSLADDGNNNRQRKTEKRPEKEKEIASIPKARL